MVVKLIRVDLLAGVQLKLAVEGMLVGLALLEELHPRRLLDPALQDASHALHGALAQFVGLSAVIVDPPIGLVQTPNGGGTVDTVSHGSHHLVGAHHGKQAGDGALVAQQLSLDCGRRKY